MRRDSLVDQGALAALEWLVGSGADDCVGTAPVDCFAASEQAVAKPPPPAQATDPSDDPAHGHRPSGPAQAPPPSEPPLLALTTPPSTRPHVQKAAAGQQAAAVNAAQAAMRCETLEDLRRAVEAFEECPLSVTATHTVFADGNPNGALMVIGEAPGRDEDRIGRPFVGTSGKLLDRILASIGQTRDTFYITNIIPWRPPGNRTPTDAEVAVCIPFMHRHIELVRPKALLLVGGLAAKSLFGGQQGITKVRGVWRAYETPGLQRPTPAMATFHPAYLLRNPSQKRLVWHDVLAVKEKLAEQS